MIELVTVIAILVLVVSLLVTIYLAGADIFGTEKNLSDIAIEGDRAMKTMVDEIRNGREVTVADNRQFTFWMQDADNDTVIDSSETVSYSWDGTSGGNLLRAVAGVPFILSKYVNDLNFTYDSGTLSSIRSVNIRLTNSIGTDVHTLESTVRLRNL